jgi:predicted transcriptional regulator
MKKIACVIIYAESTLTLYVSAPDSMTVDEVKEEAVRQMQMHMVNFISDIELEPAYTDFFPGRSLSWEPSLLFSPAD